MRTLASLTQEEIDDYMLSIGQATNCVVPKDATWCVIVNAIDGSGTHYISNARRLEIPALLRALADHLESDMSQLN